MEGGVVGCRVYVGAQSPLAILVDSSFFIGNGSITARSSDVLTLALFMTLLVLLLVTLLPPLLIVAPRRTGICSIKLEALAHLRTPFLPLLSTVCFVALPCAADRRVDGSHLDSRSLTLSGSAFLNVALRLPAFVSCVPAKLIAVVVCLRLLIR
eukprot:CAMPEP_0119549184 /NCGR_PEP_ID=MMETSP1352-20130426/2946_1 /TAXON_ID=265584 /ORGANISM="Stauroneis constricta, Strain CCMP1120" /LENGTH=153 /DNA_ID=CAMNT_0007594675 /DNA_START=130 /DNA_END=588 /DNA_ORIENTATION=-